MAKSFVEFVLLKEENEKEAFVAQIQPYIDNLKKQIEAMFSMLYRAAQSTWGKRQPTQPPIDSTSAVNMPRNLSRPNNFTARSIAANPSSIPSSDVYAVKDHYLHDLVQQSSPRNRNEAIQIANE